MDARTQKPTVTAWDLPTRLFHWSLVALLICAWASFEFSGMVGDNTYKWHRYNGYAILVLLVWRILWGIVGSSTSRFASFLAWPWTAAGYALDLVRGRPRHFLGHNPLGTYMVLALLAAVAAQAVIGLFTLEHNFVTWGPLANLISDDLAKTLTGFHVWFFESVLLVLIALHITANLIYGFVRRQPHVTAMITGRKAPGDYEDVAPASAGGVPRSSALLWAFVCLVAAAAIVLGSIKLIGGKLFY